MGSASRWAPAALWAWIAVGAILRVLASFFIALVGVGVFALIARGVAGGLTQSFDEAAIAFFVTNQPEWLRDPVLAVTSLANGPTIAVVCSVVGVALTVWKRTIVPAVELAVVVFGGWAIIEGLKTIFERPRPELRMIAEPGHSFPSGHSFFGIALYGFLAYRLAREVPPRWKRLVWSVVGLLALLVAGSRMLLGVHYPSDVLAGLVGGTAWLWGATRLPMLLRRSEWRTWHGQRLEVLRLSLATLRADGTRDQAIRAEALRLLKSEELPLWRRLLLRLALMVDRGQSRLAKRWPSVCGHALGPAIVSMVSQKAVLAADAPQDDQTVELANAFRRLIWT